MKRFSLLSLALLLMLAASIVAPRVQAQTTATETLTISDTFCTTSTPCTAQRALREGLAAFKLNPPEIVKDRIATIKNKETGATHTYKYADLEAEQERRKEASNGAA